MGHAAGLRAGTRYAYVFELEYSIATITDGLQLLEGLQEAWYGEFFAWHCTSNFDLVLTTLQIPLSTYLKQYKVGDIVDVVANGTEHST